MNRKDDAVWRQVHLDRYKNTVEAKLIRELEVERNKVLRILQSTKTSDSARRLSAAKFKEITVSLRETYDSLESQFVKSGRDLIGSELEWSTRQLQASTAGLVTSPTAAMVYASIVSNPPAIWMGKKGNIKYVANSPLRQVPAKHHTEINKVLREAYGKGFSQRSAQSKLKVLDRAHQRIDKSFDLARRNVQSEVRTGLQTYAQTARMKTYHENSDIFPWVEYTATLDIRTTEVCGSLDGRTYAAEDPSQPEIPQHWNCRSTYVPKETRGEVLDAERPSVGAGEGYEKGDRTTRTGKVRKPRKGSDKLERGQTAKAGTKFNDWLKQQDKKNPDFVRDYFKSDKRYKAWKQGKLGNIKYTTKDGRQSGIKSLSNTKKVVKQSNMIRSALAEAPVSANSFSTKGIKVTRTFKNDAGKRFGGVWEVGGRFYAKKHGKELGWFDSMDDAAAAVTGKTKLIQPKPKPIIKPDKTTPVDVDVLDVDGNKVGHTHRVKFEDGSYKYKAIKTDGTPEGMYWSSRESARLALLKKIKPKPQPKPKPTSTKMKLIEPVMNPDTGKRLGGVFGQFDPITGLTRYTAKLHGKVIGRYGSKIEARDAVLEKWLAGKTKKAPVKKATPTKSGAPSLSKMRDFTYDEIHLGFKPDSVDMSSGTRVRIHKRVNSKTGKNDYVAVYYDDAGVRHIGGAFRTATDAAVDARLTILGKPKPMHSTGSYQGKSGKVYTSAEEALLEEVEGHNTVKLVDRRIALEKQMDALTAESNTFYEKIRVAKSSDNFAELRRLEKEYNAVDDKIRGVHAEMQHSHQDIANSVKYLFKDMDNLQKNGTHNIKIDTTIGKNLGTVGVKAADQGVLRMKGLLNNKLPPSLKKMTYDTGPDGDRAYAQLWQGFVNTGDSKTIRVMMHEIGHFVEVQNKMFGDAAQEFIKRRSTTGKTVSMKKLTGGNYKKWEIAYEDKFITEYVGKRYNGTEWRKLSGSGDSVYNNNFISEVISMGIEKFTSVDAMVQFALQDPEHFKLILSVIENVRRGGTW